MKVDELMIGDWFWWEAEGKKYPMQVKAEDFALSDDDIANFEPIPITEEILKKNFEDNGYGCYDIFRNDDIGECLYYHFGYHTICYKPDKDSWSCSMPDDEIKYVHELQHFLGGIKHKIDFKI